MATVSVASHLRRSGAWGARHRPGRVGPYDFHPDRGLPGHRLQPGTVARACFHNDTTFALAWGSFPVLTAYYAQDATPAPGGGSRWRHSHTVSSSAPSGCSARRPGTSGAGSCQWRASGPTLTGLTVLSLSLPSWGPLRARAGRQLSWSTCALGVGLVMLRCHGLLRAHDVLGKGHRPLSGSSTSAGGPTPGLPATGRYASWGSVPALKSRPA